MRSILTCSLVCTLFLLPDLAISQELPQVDHATHSVPDAHAPEQVELAATPSSGAVRTLIGAAPHDKGQVVFFRPPRMMGSAIGFKVRQGEQELGKLRNGKYFVATLEAGTHEFTVHSETKDVLTMEVEPGETYYVQGTLSMGVMVGRPNLTPSDETAFRLVADKLKLAN